MFAIHLGQGVFNAIACRTTAAARLTFERCSAPASHSNESFSGSVRHFGRCPVLRVGPQRPSSSEKVCGRLAALGNLDSFLHHRVLADDVEGSSSTLDFGFSTGVRRRRQRRLSGAASTTTTYDIDDDGDNEGLSTKREQAAGTLKIVARGREAHTPISCPFSRPPSLKSSDLLSVDTVWVPSSFEFARFDLHVRQSDVRERGRVRRPNTSAILRLAAA
ncbi:hypothetical protein SCHPADRAFT_257577 [Schizopora paradoxa]|uniref:Uncharacterized protein n=1 Tax=Schizopora paradoxa TaxID=27342 RepID=A0A0H2RUX2_9AGAM|nr:hypothetical protein SCHPADRAFT_257577 [Schizopora paradoxa]